MGELEKFDHLILLFCWEPLKLGGFLAASITFIVGITLTALAY
jgi:hypothetical protein